MRLTTLCIPKPEETACIASTMGSRAEPIAGVDVTLTAPDGTEQTVTTGEDGKWSFQVTETGTYTVAADPETIPDGFELENESAEVQVDTLGGSLGVALQVRSEDYSAETSKFDEILQSSVNGLRLGLLLALASVGLSLIYGTTGLSNFAHAEQVTLGGMIGYLLINQCRAWGSGSAACWSSSSAPSPGTSRTGSCGNRYDGAGWA